MGFFLLVFDVCSDEKDQWFSLGVKRLPEFCTSIYLVANSTEVSNEHLFLDNK